MSTPREIKAQAKDEVTHPLGPKKGFNERMYFNFFDRDSGYGGFLRWSATPSGSGAPRQTAGVQPRLDQP